MADKNTKKKDGKKKDKGRKGLLEGALGTARKAAAEATPALGGGKKKTPSSSFGVTVDVAVFTIVDAKLCALLIQRGSQPHKGSWALPGGFVLADEDLEDAARRELEEETGVPPSAVHLEQLRTYGAPGRDPRMRVVSVAYVAITPELPEVRGGTDAAAAELHAIDALPELAFDHAAILDDAVERVRSKLEYTPLAAAFCPSPFTLADLRRVYEIVWHERLDPANFQRKVLGTPGFVEATGEMSASGPSGGRPARLFRRGPAEGLHPAMLRRG